MTFTENMDDKQRTEFTDALDEVKDDQLRIDRLNAEREARRSIAMGYSAIEVPK